MTGNRRANAVLFGFDFQVNAAIVLMLENIEELKSLRLEGKEDIELTLNDGKEILAQAKAVEKSSSDFTHVIDNLKKALMSLSEGACNCEVKELILITNSPNPLNDKKTQSIFYGEAHRKFDTLPKSAQEKITRYLSKLTTPLDTSKFKIQILPFETDDDLERYKVVNNVVDKFIGRLQLNVPGLGSKILPIWQSDIFHNGSKGDEVVTLDKKDIIWPIVVVATDIGSCDEKFLEEFDDAQYQEIANQYKTLINTCCERFEFCVKVLTDYTMYEYSGKKSDKIREFALTQWNNYSDKFPLSSADAETKEGLIQIILYQIVRNRFLINRIKTEIHL